MPNLAFISEVTFHFNFSKVTLPLIKSLYYFAPHEPLSLGKRHKTQGNTCPRYIIFNTPSYRGKCSSPLPSCPWKIHACLVARTSWECLLPTHLWICTRALQLPSKHSLWWSGTWSLYALTDRETLDSPWVLCNFDCHSKSELVSASDQTIQPAVREAIWPHS